MNIHIVRTKKRLFRGGLFLIFLGVLFSLINVKVTGFVIGSSLKTNTMLVLSVVFILGGILLMTAGSRTTHGGLVKKIDVYDASHGKSPHKERSYHLLDPYLNFGKADINLDDFRRGIEEIKDDPELMSIVRDEYGSRLQQIIEHGGEKAKVARQFLSVLGVERESGESNSIKLNADQKREIKDVFRDFTGDLNKYQRKILDGYGISYELSGGHWHLGYQGGSAEAVAPSTPSDWRTGRNLASELIKVIERRRKTK